MMKRFAASPILASFPAFASTAVFLLGLIAASGTPLPAQTIGPQHLVVAGLRSVGGQGQFNAVSVDAAGNLFLLLDQKDGVRVLKTDSTATNLLDSARIGAAGDIGLAMALDPAGNVYVTGTTQSGSLSATAGAAFSSPVDTTVNSFVAKFDTNLNLSFLTFGGSSRTAATAITATNDAVFITGLIYSSTLPVTPSAIIQAPAYQSKQNGFVERFSADGKTLAYATYLSGTLGDTSPLTIAADIFDDAYIGGFTTAPGFPTVAALIPRTTDPTTGFLIKLTPAADGIIFSTYIPGSGVNSLAMDAAAGNLLLSGTISLGQFPVATVTTPLVSTPYQVLLRMPLDGSAVISSTVLAPGMQSSVVAGLGGVAWVDGTMSTPLLPSAPPTQLGNAYALRISPSSAPGGTTVDLATRFGGLPVANPNYSSLPISLNAIAVDASGSPVAVGSIAPTTSSSLLASTSFDLPLTNAPTTALPSSLHDAMLASCTNSSLCAGSAAFLARIVPSGAPSLAFSVDASPIIILHNLGSVEADSLQLSASSFTTTSTCGQTLPAGADCAILLGGSGPGTLTASATAAVTQTVAIGAIPPAANPDTLVISPRELDFGVQAATSPALQRTFTVTNLGSVPQIFVSKLNGNAKFMPYTFVEASSDCPLGLQANTKQLDPGANCHITLSLTALPDPSKDGPAQAQWNVGNGAVKLTGFTEAASLSLSASTVDFGTQFFGGLTSPRFLYLSNNSAATVRHTLVALPASSPFKVTDRCAQQIAAGTVCQIEIDYASPVATSTDSVSLALDQGLAVLLSGVTLPPPGVNGATAPPSLSVSPTATAFTNAVVVTGVSSNTQTVTIQNTGNSSFALALSLTGDFTDQTTCGTSLGAGSSCNVILSFAPSQPGTRNGLLTVTAGSGTAPVNVSLSGIGTPILPANNGSFDFGSVPLNQPTVQWYKVSQPFSTLTASTGDPNFHVVLVEDVGYGHGQPAPSSFLTATTGSCVNCWLGIQFTPSATGPLAATLTLASSTAGNPYVLNLTGAGVANAGILLTPTTQDFGTIGVGSSSAPVQFTLTNLSSATAPVTVNAPAATGDFSISNASSTTACSGSLAANASCSIQVVFSPATAGQRPGALTVATSAGTATSALSGFGGTASVGGATLTFTPSALTFQNVPGPSATQQTVTVNNIGTNTVQVGTPANANPAFSTTPNCSALAPSGSCTLTVTYAPGAAVVSDTLQIPVTAMAGGSTTTGTYTIGLRGAYTAQDAGLQIFPATADFGAGPVNLAAGIRQFTLTNLTAKTLAITAILPRQFVLSGPPCTSLPPNGSCTLSLGFVPLTNGSITGTLSIQAAPSDGSASLSTLAFLSGFGTGTGSLSFTGNIAPGRVVSFGQVPSGQSSQQVITLTNNSPAGANSAVNIRRISSSWPFLSTTTCGDALAVGQSCTVTVVYTPLNQVVAGSSLPPAASDGGSLRIESDATSAPDVLDLTGTATPASVSSPTNTAPLVTFTASENSLLFPTTAIGYTSAAQIATLTNTGTTTLHITGLVTSSDFNVSGNCSVLLPAASCQLSIAFQPQLSTQPAGSRLSALEIRSDSTASLEFITLDGNAGPATLTFQPAARSFGVLAIGSTATLPIVITNASATAVVFNAINTTGDYTAAGNCPPAGSSLAPGATCTLQITFAPTTTGTRSGSLSIASSASQNPLVALLTGVGAQSHLTVNPTSLSFGSVSIGSTSALSFTLANTGTAAIRNIAFAAIGDYAVTQPCSFTTLSAGASCSVQVSFVPTAGGARSGTLTVTSSDPSSPTNIPLTGTGINSSPANTATFTLQVNGATSATQTVAAPHAATYTVSIASLNGFVGNVALGCNAVTVAPYATCSMSASTLSLSAGGTQSATVTINTLTSASLRTPVLRSINQTALCLLAPSALLFWRFRRTLRRRPSSLFLAIVFATMMVLVSGCGGGAPSTLRVTPSGTYQYLVSASSTAGTPITQTVTLNLNIP